MSTCYCVHAPLLMFIAHQYQFGVPEQGNRQEKICAQAIGIYHKNDIYFGPAKAANAGGVAVSGLEMCQNSMRLLWSREEVEDKLKGIMKDIFDNAQSVRLPPALRVMRASAPFAHCKSVRLPRVPQSQRECSLQLPLAQHMSSVVEVSGSRPSRVGARTGCT